MLSANLFYCGMYLFVCTFSYFKQGTTFYNDKRLHNGCTVASSILGF